MSSPLGFESVDQQPYMFRGRLTRQRIVFEFESDPYPPDWTGRFKADVTLAVGLRETA